MRPMSLAVSFLLCWSLAPCPAAQGITRPRAEVNLSNGLPFERGTNISAAPRARGIATSPVALPPRNAQEVWTSKLVFHAWAMEPSLGSGNRDVYLARSTDGGVTFAAPGRLEAQAGSAEEVTVVAHGHAVCVSWLSAEGATTDQQVWAALSFDQGATFLPPVLLNDPALVALGDSDEHWTAATGTAFYVVWEFDDRGRAATTGDEDLRFNRIDFGSGNVQLAGDVRVNQAGSSNIDDVDSPFVVADPGSGDVAVLWFDDRGAATGVNALFAVTSRNFGQAFGVASDTRLTGPPTANVSNRNNTRAVIAGGLLHFVFEDRRNVAAGGLDEPFYNRYDLVSGTLLHAGDRNLADWPTPGASDMDQPWLAVNTDNPAEVIACWHDDRDALGGANNLYNDVFYTVSRDAGMTWSANARASRTSGRGTGERNEAWAVAWQGDHVVICAERSAGNTSTVTNEDVVVFLSQDGARTWAVEFLTRAGSVFGLPGIDIDNPFLATTAVRNDIVTSYLNGAASTNDLTARGMRVPFVALTGDFVPGNSVQIQVRQIAETNRGGITFLVYHSVSSPIVPGFFPFDRGADVDLVFDAVTLALVGIQPLSVMLTPPGGVASTPAITVPPGYRPALRVQGVVFDATLRARETTDPFAF